MILIKINGNFAGVTSRRGHIFKATIPLSLALVLLSCHRQQTFDDKTLADIRDFNDREAPKQMDPVTTLDSMGYQQEDRTLTYFYTLSGMADDPSVLTDEIVQAQQEALLENLRVSIQLKPYKEQGISFEYLYYSQTTGQLLMRYLFTADDYE